MWLGKMMAIYLPLKSAQYMHTRQIITGLLALEQWQTLVGEIGENMLAMQVMYMALLFTASLGVSRLT